MEGENPLIQSDFRLFHHGTDGHCEWLVALVAPINAGARPASRQVWFLIANGEIATIASILRWADIGLSLRCRSRRPQALQALRGLRVTHCSLKKLAAIARLGGTSQNSG